MKKNTYILETSRLGLREITEDDAELAYQLNLDEEVIRYTGDEPFGSVDETRSFLQKYDHYRTYGFGRWGVIRKEDGAFLGWCGLKYTPGLDEYDLGFRFFRKYWKQGYATEAAKACLHAGFDRFRMPRIVGRVMPANLNSVNVLNRLGFRFFNRELDDGCEWDIYEIFPGR